MAFKADAFVAAMEPPAIEIDGVVYTGRLLSELEFEQLIPAFDEWIDGSVQDPAMKLRELLATLGFDEASQTAILGLPPAAIVAAITDFFLSHNRPPARPAPGLTSGSNSPRPVGAAPAASLTPVPTT